jgi:purine-binding chemotaxis protein CheW
MKNMGTEAFSLNSGEKLITELPIVRFKIENTSYGFDVSRVLEILRYEPITRVPNVADQFQGVINLRGQIIPIINLRKRFSMPNISKTKATRILIITYGNETVGIIVDRVQEVVNVLINRIIPKPRYFQNKIESSFFQGLARHQKSAESEEQLILLLNIPRIINLKYQSKYSSDLDKIIKRKTKLLEEQREFLKKKLMAKKKRMLEAQKIEALKKSIGQKTVQKKEKGLKEDQNSSVKEQIPLEKMDPQIINATEMKSLDALLYQKKMRLPHQK